MLRAGVHVSRDVGWDGEDIGKGLDCGVRRNVLYRILHAYAYSVHGGTHTVLWCTSDWQPGERVYST